MTNTPDNFVPGNTATIWVCVDCYTVHHTGEEPDTTPDREPWGLIDDDCEVTSGCFPGQCLAGDDHETREDCEEDDYECNRDSFSSTPCSACGSYLAGEREVFTLWYKED